MEHSVETTIEEELRHIPEGDRSSAQDTLRKEYAVYRREDLARNRESRPDAALLRAVASIKRWAPDFEPEYDQTFFD